ncbi:phosphoribosylanthranilate isomerase [bacterium]|nr:phosphoribosylanthranilate isomerase [bacterium]
MFVKVCGNTSEDSLRRMRSLPIQAFGFLFVSTSPRALSREKGKRLRSLLPPEAQAVGVFQDHSPEEVLSYVRELTLDVVQLHGSESAATVRQLSSSLKPLGVSLWKSILVAEVEDIEAASEYLGIIDVLLFDTRRKPVDSGQEQELRGGSGEKFSWDLLEHYRGEVPFLLAGGVSPNDAEEVLRLARRFPQMKGVDLNSRFESAPGEKESVQVRNFLEELGVSGGAG